MRISAGQWPTTLVAVVGKGRNCPAEVYELAWQVGGFVGRRPDCLLITGGLGGAMAAAADGAREQGGRVLGLLPGKDNRSTDVYPHLDIELDTGLTAHGRNIVLANAASLVIAVPGSHGSWQETILAIDAEKPVIGVGDHSVRLPGVEYLDSVTELPRHLDRFVAARSSGVTAALASRQSR